MSGYAPEQHCVCVVSAGELYSTPKICSRTPACPDERRVRLWTTGQNVRCTNATAGLAFPANGTDLPFKYAVLEVRTEKKHA